MITQQDIMSRNNIHSFTNPKEFMRQKPLNHELWKEGLKVTTRTRESNEENNECSHAPFLFCFISPPMPQRIFSLIPTTHKLVYGICTILHEKL